MKVLRRLRKGGVRELLKKIDKLVRTMAQGARELGVSFSLMF